jgi:hypothetical protein
MIHLPLSINLLIYISLASLLSGIIALLFFILNLIGRVFQRKGIGLIQSAFIFALILIWIVFSAAGLFLTSFIQPYRSFTDKELVAVVRCKPLDDKTNTMQMGLRLVKDGKTEKEETFMLKGDQWAIEGDILRWDDRLNLLGLHAMYRLTRVRGRYIDAQNEIQNTPTVYSLVKDEGTPYWRWLYRYGYRLPFVTAVYGNTVFTYPSKEDTYEIYVTTSGFMAQAKGKRE